MPHYKFNTNITVDGKPFTDGTVADGAEIPSGCITSMLRLGQIEEVASPVAKPAAIKEKPKTKSK